MIWLHSLFLLSIKVELDAANAPYVTTSKTKPHNGCLFCLLLFSCWRCSACYTRQPNANVVANVVSVAVSVQPQFIFISFSVILRSHQSHSAFETSRKKKKIIPQSFVEWVNEIKSKRPTSRSQLALWWHNKCNAMFGAETRRRPDVAQRLAVKVFFAVKKY